MQGWSNSLTVWKSWCQLSPSNVGRGSPTIQMHILVRPTILVWYDASFTREARTFLENPMTVLLYNNSTGSNACTGVRPEFLTKFAVEACQSQELTSCAEGRKSWYLSLDPSISPSQRLAWYTISLRGKSRKQCMQRSKGSAAAPRAPSFSVTGGEESWEKDKGRIVKRERK